MKYTCEVCSKSIRLLFIISAFTLNIHQIHLTLIPFKVLPLSCYTRLPIILPLPEAECLFWYCVHLVCHLLHYVFSALKSGSFQRHFQLGKNQKSHGAKLGLITATFCLPKKLGTCCKQWVDVFSRWSCKLPTHVAVCVMKVI